MRLFSVSKVQKCIRLGILLAPCGVNDRTQNHKQSLTLNSIFSFFSRVILLELFVFLMLYGLQRSIIHIIELQKMAQEIKQKQFCHLFRVRYSIYLVLENATKMHSQTFHSSTLTNLKSDRDLTSRFIKIDSPVKSVIGVV